MLRYCISFIVVIPDIADTIGYLLMGSSEQASQEIEVRHVLLLTFVS